MIRNWDKIYNECMTELYANAEPKADFNELVDHAKKNGVMDQFGRYDIQYDNYHIDRQRFDEIFNSCVEKHKIKQPYLSQFSFAIYMGASPSTKTT